jgi:hypothetical protein
MYKERMYACYPRVIQNIVDFRAILDSEYPEIEDLALAKNRITENAYLLTMNEDRISEWEQALGIKPVEGSSVEDRRETIIARIRGQGKLNTESINTIVKTFTGGTAKSWVKDSVLYVEITPPPGNKSYQFANVEQELKVKVPAHLGFNVRRNYYEWDEVNKTVETWQDVYDTFDTWDNVLIFTDSQQ